MTCISAWVFFGAELGRSVGFPSSFVQHMKVCVSLQDQTCARGDMARDQPVPAEKASEFLDVQLLARRWLGAARGDRKPLPCLRLSSDEYGRATTFVLRTDKGFRLMWLVSTDQPGV